MAMTKKHYEMVARHINAEHTAYASSDIPPVSSAVFDAMRELSEYLAKEFAADNPNFDRAKFLRACGVVEA